MELAIGDKVNIFIEHRTPLGYTVKINNDQEGLLYHNEIYEDLFEGQETIGYVKKIREDGKIDVSLQAQGFRNVIDSNTEAILDKLNSNKGFLPLHDGSSPNAIYAEFKMSKKAFKKAVGNLYKLKQIRIETNGIYLVN